MENSEANALIRLPEVSRLTGLSDSTIYRFARTYENGKSLFPKPVKLGRSSGWVKSEVLDWIKARMNERAA